MTLIRRPGLRRPGGPKASTAPTLTAADIERAKTWLSTIAEACLTDPEWHEEGDERKYRHTGGLSINMKSRGWYHHSAKCGGSSAIKLICHLKEGWSYKDAAQWLTAFLAASPGTGPCGVSDGGGAGDDDDTAPASAAECREVLENCRDLTGTASEVYLKRRGLPGPYPADLLGHLDDARIGESAFVAKLTEHGRITGVLLTYLTPDGEKSLVEPVRRRLNLEKSAGGVLRIPEPDPAAPLDPVADYLVCEGVEDALSLAQLGRNLTIFGVPGVGTIQHLDLPKGARVTVVKDGDEPDTPAAKALINGVDVQLLKGVYPRVTETPLGDDANKILQEHGLEALRELAARPPEAALSFHGRIIRLSKIDDPVASAEERKLIAKIFGVSVKVIDEGVKKLRPPRVTPADTPAADTPSSYEGAADPAWEGDVDLAAALNSAVIIMQRFLKAPAYVYDTTALWATMTYLVQSEEIDLPIAPQLGFQSLVEASGKSVAAEIVAALSYRGYLRASYTASTLFRQISEKRVTPCLSEFHNILGDKDKSLLAIVDACHRRSEAFVDRTEIDPQTGQRYVVSYRCWAALCWGAIGAVPREVQSRSIILPLQAALPDESHALDHSRPLQAKDLIDVRRQLAKWATGIKALPAPSMPPTLFNRAADNFRPLFAIAELAGGDWPKRIIDAAEAIGKVERRPSPQARLLTDIRAIFKAAANQQLATVELLEKLCEDEELGWQQANHGKRIDGYWLRENLRGLIAPSGSQHWHEGRGSARVDVRGYQLYQFTDAFLRYLPPSMGEGAASAPSDPSDTAPASEPVSPLETVESYGSDVGADGAADTPRHPPRGKLSKFNGEGPSEADGADGADSNAEPLKKEEEDTTPIEPAPSASAEPNGATPGSKRKRPSRIDDLIRATAKDHPDWDPAQIGKHCGRPEGAVRRVLGTEAKQ
jgi:hypothetical protein